MKWISRKLGFGRGFWLEITTTPVFLQKSSELLENKRLSFCERQKSAEECERKRDTSKKRLARLKVGTLHVEENKGEMENRAQSGKSGWLAEDHKFMLPR